MSKIEMIEETIRAGLGHFSPQGALIVDTGRHTGRATKERFLVQRPETIETVGWGNVNKPIAHEFAKLLFTRLNQKIQNQKFYSFKGCIGGYPLVVRSLSPWHIAFAENMFRSEPLPSVGEVKSERIEIFHDPFGKISDLGLSHESETLIVIDPAELKVAIVGTAYAGEIKKSAFSVCNYRLPDDGFFSMHASANCLQDGTESCVLFGLSGTGKTTLSASPDRYLIGDDEVVWSDRGIFNLENGCYAKLINLTLEREPEIYRASNQFGSILENVAYDPITREVDFASSTRTENTRGSYSLDEFERVFPQDRMAAPPRNVVFLVADAFGAMPAVARLDLWQAQYHFLSGYTSKLAGTEMGVKEPTATFSACFGEPFMPRNPHVYARMLSQFAQKHGASVWMLNTGWNGGGYGKGSRFPLTLTRRLLTAIQNGEMDAQPMERHPIFGFEVPTSCPGVEPDWLRAPEGSAVVALAEKFMENMKRFKEESDVEVIQRGGPNLSALDSSRQKRVAS